MNPTPIENLKNSLKNAEADLEKVKKTGDLVAVFRAQALVDIIKRNIKAWEIDNA